VKKAMLQKIARKPWMAGMVRENQMSPSASVTGAFELFLFFSDNTRADAVPESTVFHDVANQVTQTIRSRLPHASFVMNKVILHPVARKTGAKVYTQTVAVASYAERILTSQGIASCARKVFCSSISFVSLLSD
jgi:hypothetical protein